MKSFYLIIFFGMGLMYSQAQSPDVFLSYAEDAMESKQWPIAFEWAKQAYDSDTTSFEAQAVLAVCAYEIKEFELSSRLFLRMNAKDLGQLQPDALFYVASAKKQMGEYEEAEIYFRSFLKKSKSTNPYFKSKAKQEIKNCVWAKEYVGRIDSLHHYRLPQKYQHKEADILPRVTGDDVHFYFKSEDHWQGAFIQDTSVVVESNPEILAVSVLDRLAVGISNKNGIPKLVECQLNKDSLWTTKKEIELLNEDGGYIGMPCLANIEGITTLFFVSDREGGEGGKDIWISRLQKNGTWQKPFNAGKKVNSQDDELSPFYAQERLFFSSSWLEGFGGWDVYYAEGKPGSFALATNAGKPINSNFNDWGLSIYPEKNIGFFASDRPLNDSTSLPPCCTDIYAFVWQPKLDSIPTKKDSLMMVVTDVNMQLPIKLYFHNDEPNPNSLDTLTTFTFLETTTNYFSLKSKYITKLTEQEKDNKFIEEEVSAFYENELQQGIDKLAKLEKDILTELKKGSHVRVTVRGFASPRAASDYNRRISLRRISSIRNQWMQDPRFTPYFQSGSLELVGIPFGESKAASDVSDDISNEKKSIYSKGARLERRVEIERVEIERILADSICIKWNETLSYLGKVQPGSQHVISFELTNCGNTTLYIEDVESSCGCTIPEVTTTEISPKEKVTIKATYTVSQKSEGKEIRFVSVNIKGLPTQILTIESIVTR
jgi:tetratricopeptide (TPR) repeat protein